MKCISYLHHFIKKFDFLELMFTSNGLFYSVMSNGAIIYHETLESWTEILNTNVTIKSVLNYKT